MCRACYSRAHNQADHAPHDSSSEGKNYQAPNPLFDHPTICKFLLTWQKELADDEDKQFLLHGLAYGFPLIDTDPANINISHASNHKSCAQHHNKASKRLLEEIKHRNYIKTSTSEIKLASPLAAILKPDGDVRVIYDLSHQIFTDINIPQKTKVMYASDHIFFKYLY